MGSLLDLAEDHPDALMLLVGGDREDVRRLRAQIDARGLENVRLEGRVSIAEVARYLSLADVLLLPPTAGPLMSHGNTVLPMKTFTYLAAGRPVLAPDLLDTEGILVHERNCLRVEPDDRLAASEALGRLLRDDRLRRELGENARQDALQYTWGERAKRLIRFLDRRLGELG
jgi:glycosyltransferase involved in cell wall biosynthesis